MVGRGAAVGGCQGVACSNWHAGPPACRLSALDSTSSMPVWDGEQQTRTSLATRHLSSRPVTVFIAGLALFCAHLHGRLIVLVLGLDGNDAPGRVRQLRQRGGTGCAQQSVLALSKREQGLSGP